MTKLKNIQGSWLRLWNVLGDEDRKKYVRMVTYSVVIAIIEILGVSLLLHTILSILKPKFVQHNIFTSFLYDSLQIEDYQNFVLIITLLLFVGYLLKNIVLVQINKVQVRLAYEITDNLSSKHYEYIASKPFLYFKARKSSEVINELFTVTASFAESVLLASIMLISELFVISLILLAILFYKPELFVFTFVTVFPVAAILVYANRTRLEKYGKKMHNNMPKMYENITELTQGIAQVKLWNAEDHAHMRFQQIKQDVYDLQQKIVIKAKHIPTRIYEVIAVTGILCVVLYGVLGDIGSSALISAISIYAGVSFRLLPSMNKVISSFNGLHTHQHLLEYLQNTEKVQSDDFKRSSLVLEKHIQLHEVSFEYKKDTPILTNLNLTISKGEFVGIVGASGEGKSTLVNLICALMEPSKGKLLVDGKEVDSSLLDAYRFIFSYVKQDVFMLNASIAENVALYSSTPDKAKIMECLEAVNLLSWVDSLSNGVNSQVGEVGNNISGGQRQRIAIARALYKDAEVFIFDEMTNNLDDYSKKQTQMAVANLKRQGKTAIFITHKQDELILTDKVYSLDDGQLVQIK